MIEPHSSKEAEAFVERSVLLAQLAASLGKAKAEEVLAKAEAELGLAGTQLSPAQALSLLERLAAEPGVAGIAARCLRVRVVLGFRR